MYRWVLLAMISLNITNTYIIYESTRLTAFNTNYFDFFVY